MSVQPDFAGEAWPTADQTLLLQAALLPAEAASAAWQAWRARTDLDHLDAGSRRLLPLLYRNLRAQGVQHPDLARYKEVYRTTWAKNQALFHRIARLLKALRQAGLPTLVLKGAPLAVLHYRDAGLRPMSDFDILVPTADAPRAFDCLSRLGWEAQFSGPPEWLVPVRQAISYRNADSQDFDLHWHVLWERCGPDDDAPFWQAAVPVSIAGEQTLTLCPADQLLHACAHGARYNDFPTVRWAADATVIIRQAGPALDWDRLLSLAGALGMSLPLRDTLRFLHSQLEVPLPPEVLDRLAAIPVTAGERRFYGLKLLRPGWLGALPLQWHHYRGLGLAAGRRPSLAGFLTYMMRTWGLGRARELPGYVAYKARRRLRAMTTRRPAG